MSLQLVQPHVIPAHAGTMENLQFFFAVFLATTFLGAAFFLPPLPNADCQPAANFLLEPVRVTDMIVFPRMVEFDLGIDLLLRPGDQSCNAGDLSA